MFNFKSFFTSFIAYASSGGLGVASSFKPILTGMVGLSSAVAVLSTAICILRYMVSDDPQTTRSAIEDVKVVWIAYICLNSIGLIMSFVLGLIDSSKF